MKLFFILFLFILPDMGWANCQRAKSEAVQKCTANQAHSVLQHSQNPAGRGGTLANEISDRAKQTAGTAAGHANACRGLIQQCVSSCTPDLSSPDPGKKIAAQQAINECQAQESKAATADANSKMAEGLSEAAKQLANAMGNQSGTGNSNIRSSSLQTAALDTGPSDSTNESGAIPSGPGSTNGLLTPETGLRTAEGGPQTIEDIENGVSVASAGASDGSSGTGSGAPGSAFGGLGTDGAGSADGKPKDAILDKYGNPIKPEDLGIASFDGSGTSGTGTAKSTGMSVFDPNDPESGKGKNKQTGVLKASSELSDKEKLDSMLEAGRKVAGKRKGKGVTPASRSIFDEISMHYRNQNIASQ